MIKYREQTKGRGRMETKQYYVYKCPICGHTFEEDKVEREDRTCSQCGKSTYTIRSKASIRKVLPKDRDKLKRD